MPSITAYTPFETLKFCQSIAQNGALPPSFEELAASLNANDLIRESETYDQTKLTATALEDLYADLLVRERDGSPQVTGDASEDQTSSRKRKASSSPEQENGDPTRSEEGLMNSLVDKLYARFREEVIKEIKKDEEEYALLQAEIKELESQPESTPTQAEQQPRPAPLIPHKRQPSRTDVSSLLSPHDETPAYSKQGQEERQSASRPSSNDEGRPQVIPNLPPVVPSQHSPAPSSSRLSAEPAQPAQPPNLNQSPASFNRTLPPPSPQRPGFGLPPTHHGYSPAMQGHSGPILPPPPGMPQHMPPPMDYANQKRSSSTSTPNRGSPVPLPQQGYPGYPQYQQQPPWPPPQYPPPHQPYPQHMQYPNQPPYYAHSPIGRPPYQPQHQSPYPQYHQVPPGHYPGPPPQGYYQQSQQQQPQQQQQFSRTVSAASTPVSQSTIRAQSIRSAGSSTPWKRTPLRPGQPRPQSPSRPERDVSPLTDTEEQDAKQLSARETSRKPTPAAEPLQRPRRGRPPSATPSAIPDSRSQSLASHKSETPSAPPTTRRTQTIKDETPSTPLASSDIDASRPRRGRPRNTTATATSTPRPSIDLSRPATTQKRKRSPQPTIGTSSASPPLPSPAAAKLYSARHSSIYAHDPGLVLVSKTFAKTSQLVLNEITGHKLASIFAKPLSARDAPGYKDLVLRPTDLKSIRAAVSKGSRTAVAAIEALECRSPDDDDDEVGDGGAGTPTKTIAVAKRDGTTEEGQKEGEIKVTGMYLVKKAEELVPPKGIVNSGQLEMELVRMFANAVMFNPLSSGERGFGRNLRLRKNGGDVGRKFKHERDDDGGDEGDGSAGGTEDGEGSETSTSETESGSEGGGIIADAREMFEDISKSVARWREVEVERITGVSGGPKGAGDADSLMRQGSVSMSVSSALHHEDTEDGGGTPGAGEGDGEEGRVRGRAKRRRVNE